MIIIVCPGLYFHLKQTYFILFYFLQFDLAGFTPAQPVFTLVLKVPFPLVILNKSRSSRGSIHGSTIVTGGNEDEKETMRIWFASALAKTTHFDLPKPEDDERQSSASKKFTDYKLAIEHLGLKVWDIQQTTGDTISVVLQDSLGLQKELSGRADFVISSEAALCQGAALQHALCVVEIQSKDNELDCEYQLVTYLVLMMNRFGLARVAGILMYTDGRCRAFRASRDGDGAVYEQNDTFLIYQIAEVLPVLLNF